MAAGAQEQSGRSKTNPSRGEGYPNGAPVVTTQGHDAHMYPTRKSRGNRSSWQDLDSTRITYDGPGRFGLDHDD